MRAKLIVNSVELFTGLEIVNMTAVTNGTNEDNTFSKYTPAAKLVLHVSNPDLFGKHVPGQKFYVDFTKAD